MMKEIEGSQCPGCGNKVGPSGCCMTIAHLESKLVIYRYALERIVQAEGKTMLGECCALKECQPSPDGASCSFQYGANQAFNRMASVAERALDFDLDIRKPDFQMEAAL